MNRAGASIRLVWVVSSLVAAGAAIGLFRLHDLTFLDGDAAQYLSTARNLLAGHGASTDVLYYDEHYRFGTVPAPQTVFPPGLPLILASALALGADPAQASALAGVAGFCVTGLLLAACLIRLGITPLVVLLGVGTWFTLALAWINVLEGLSEVVYTPMTLASAAALLSPSASRARLLAAGFFAAAALLIRYQAVFFLGALALWWFVLQLIKRPVRFWRVMTSGAALFVLPVGAALFIFGRNIALLGSAGGGPIDTVQSGISGVDLIRTGWWAISNLTGVSLRWMAEAGIGVWLLAAGLLLLSASAVSALRVRTQIPVGAEVAHARRSALLLSVAYLAVSAAGLALLASTRAGAYLQGRFLVPLVPFAVILWVATLDSWLRSVQGRARWAAAIAVVLLHAGLLVAQISVAKRQIADLRSDRRIDVIRSALDTSIDGDTLRNYLQQRVTARSPAFVEPAQQAWLLLDRPVLGPAMAGFSTTRWTAEDLRRLEQCYNVQFVLFFPPLFDPALPHNANRVIFADLARGEIPSSLRVVLRSTQVELYRLEREGPAPPHDCSAAKRAH